MRKKIHLGDVFLAKLSFNKINTIGACDTKYFSKKLDLAVE